MIDALQHTTGTNLVSPERAPVAVTTPDTTNFAVPDDRFQPSPVAAALASAPVEAVRPEKVAQLRAAIASGSYKVSAGKLADAMIAARALWP